MLSPIFTLWCWVTLNQVPSMSRMPIKELNQHRVMTNRMTHIQTLVRKLSKTEKCVLVANSVWALTKPWYSRELSPYSWPCHCNNDSDSCHYQEEEKLKLGCESAFSRKPNKTEEQQKRRRLVNYG